jgi:chromosome segregation ATPase
MNNDEMNTHPMIEALFARLDEWGARYTTELAAIRAELAAMRAELAATRADVGQIRNDISDLQKGQEELRAGQRELRKGYEQLRNDLNTGLRRVERKIEILNDNLLTMKADIRDLETRVEKLESERPG